MNLRRVCRAAVALVALFSLGASAWAAGAETTELREIARPPIPSRWASPLGLPKPLHELPPPAGPLFAVREQGAAAAEPRVPAAADRGRLCVVVEGTIFDALGPALATYQQDLANDGYEVVVVKFVSGSAEGLRGLLASIYDEPDSLVGALLIGDLPYIIYEMMQEFDGGVLEYEDFPCDLFYMDLNGTWLDALDDQQVQAGNGKYDTRYGNEELEIWVGRLKADALPSLGSEVAILEQYFAKSHAYREGTLHADCQALVYPDDDWSYMGYDDMLLVGLDYGSENVLLINDPNSTTAFDYLSRIEQPCELIHTRSHGYAQGHNYYRDDYVTADWVYASDYVLREPPALFYSFYVCSGSDYTESDYLAGTVALNPESGLLAWGTTKTGGMWLEDSFYTSLAAGSSFGEAFVTWYNTVSGPYPGYAPRWWYGMALTGDASITLISFPDVPRYHWAFREVGACDRAGIVGGYEDGSYHGEWTVNRGQMAVFVARGLAGGEEGVPDFTGTPTFPDVGPEHWALDYIEHAVSQNIVGGFEDGTYGPELAVTRGQMAVYVARSMVAPDTSVLDSYVPAAPRNFPDVPSSYWAYTYVEYCVEQGVVGGYLDGTYRPDTVVTRDQMAVYVARAFGLGE